MKPSTTVRASSSRLPIRARTFGIDEPRAGHDVLFHYIPDFGFSAPARREQLVDDRVGRDAFRLGAEVREHAVPQHGMRQRADVLEAHVIAAARQRARLRAEHQILRRAHAGAERHELLHRLGRLLRLRPARPHDAQRVAHHRLGHRHAPHQPLERDQVVAVHRPLEMRIDDRRRRPHDVELLVFRRVLDDDVEHEAVELRFGQRIRALELDRVLRGEHEERLGQVVGAPLNRDAVLLHRLEQRRLRLGRRAVDFVGQHDVREDRPRREHHLAPAGRRVLVDDVGAGDVRRHQVRRELDAVELQVQHLRQRRDEQRLRQAGHADDQAVAADEQRQQHQLDDVGLADDPLLQLGDDLLPAEPSSCPRARCRRPTRNPQLSVPRVSLRGRWCR